MCARSARNAVSPLILRAIHRAVGARAQASSALRLIGICGHPEAGGDRDRLAASQKRLRFDPLAQPLRDDSCALVMRLHQENHELVTTVAEYGVDLAHALFQAFTDAA